MGGDSGGVSTFLWGGHSGSPGESHPIPPGEPGAGWSWALGWGGTAQGHFGVIFPEEVLSPEQILSC